MNRNPILLCRIGFGLCVGVLVAGCAAPDDSATALRDAARVPAGWSQPVPAGPAPADLRNWWHALGDARLDALVDEALAHNLDLAQAVSRLRQARLQSGRAATQFRPSLSANALTLQDISATDTYFHASIDMVWELGLFGAGQSVRAASRAEASEAVADAQGVRVAVVAGVVRDYLDLRAAGRLRQRLQQMAALDDRGAELSAVRLRLRLGSADEIAQARVQAAQSRAAAAVAQEAGARAALALATLLGRNAPDPAWGIDAATGDWPTRQPMLASFGLTALPTDLLRTRPDVQAAEAEVHQAAAAVGLARSALYPRIALTGSLLYSFNITQNRRNRSDNAPAVGPVIDIPLFDWGRRRLLVDVREEALNAALIAYRRAVNNGVAETEGALAGLAAQQGRAASLATALAASRERTAAGRTLMHLGLSSEIDSIAPRRAELQADIDLAVARDAEALAFVALYKALGGAPLPTPSPVPVAAMATTGSTP